MVRHRLCATLLPLLCAAPAAAQTTIPASDADWIIEGLEDHARVGNEAAAAGDVDGDGFDDVLVSGYSRLSLYRGSPAGLETGPSWQSPLPALGSFYLGFAAGDVNGDGFDDVLVGEPENDDPSLDTGRAMLFIGSASGLNSAPVWMLPGDAPRRNLGWNLGGGDVNGDGFSDVVVLTGDTVRVFAGSPSGPATAPAWTFTLQQKIERGGSLLRPEFFLGNPAARLALQDLNGDGYEDLALTTIQVTVDQQGNIKKNRAGRLLVFMGSDLGLGTKASMNMNLNIKDWQAGYAAPGGDVNGDGYDDLAIMINSGRREEESVGGGNPAVLERVEIYHGSAAGLSQQLHVLMDGVRGTTIDQATSAGDINGDGFGDLLVAQSYDSSLGSPYFALTVFAGSAAGLNPAPVLTITPEQPGDDLFPFWSASVYAGDVNRDGYGDLLVGAPFFNHSFGRAYAFLGKASFSAGALP